MHKLKNILLYGGLEKDEYLAIRENIRETNRTSLVVYALLAGVGMLVLLLLSFVFPVLASSREAYALCVGVSTVILLIALTIAKKHTIFTPICVQTFTTVLLAFGIILGTVVEPNQASASYGILMFAVPLLFTSVPIIIDTQLIFSIVVYLFAARATQSPEMYSFNVSIVLPYGITALIFGVLIMRMKISRHMLDHVNKILSEKDQLTGMLNRRCYEQKLAQLRKHDRLKALFCAFDVNGLKQVNDTLGHQAGDELLCGAADCIQSVFGRYGSCYRIGGDEFFAIIEGAAPEAEELQKEFEKRNRAFHGVLVSGLSVSLGMSVCGSGASVTAATQIADGKMYEEKEKYHNR